MKTDDGGQSWKQAFPAAGEPGAPAPIRLEASVLDNKRAWVAAINPGEGGGHVVVYRTSDGSADWATSEVVDSLPVSSCSISMVDDRTGFLMLTPSEEPTPSAGRIYRTQDGGATWKLAGTTEGLHEKVLIVRQIEFFNSKRGWFKAHEDPSTPYKLYATEDGGASWYRSELPFPKELSQGHVDLQSLPTFFVQDDKRAILTTTFSPLDGSLSRSYTVVYRSTDRGKTWQATSPVSYISVSSFIDSDQGWIWSPEPRLSDLTNPPRGTLHHTDNGGKTWTPTDTNLAQYLQRADVQELDFVDSKYGWALTRSIDQSEAGLLRTEDGGKTWNSVSARIRE